MFQFKTLTSKGQQKHNCDAVKVLVHNKCFEHSDDDFRGSRCQNVSHQQQSYSVIHSPDW